MYTLKKLTISIFLAMAVFITGFAITGCQQMSDNQTATENDEQFNDDNQILTDNQKEQIREEKKEFKAKIENKIDAIDKEIKEIDQTLEEKGENVRDDIKAEYNELKRDLQNHKRTLETKMDEADRTAEDNWQEFKDESQEWWNEVELEMKALKVEIKDAFTRDQKAERK